MANALATTYDLAVTTSLSTTPHLAVGRFESGRIISRTYNSGSGITLTVYESDKFDGEYAICTDAGTAGVLAALEDNESVALPTVLKGSAYLKFVGNVEGDIQVVLKAE